MSKTIDCGLDMAGVTASAQGVFFVVLGVEGENNDWQLWWTDLSHHTEWPASWANVTAAAPVLILKFEGACWDQVAREVYLAFGERFKTTLPEWGDLKSLEHLAWEAVAKHLTWLFDLDEVLEVGELAATEVRYGAWAKNRLNKERNPE